MNLRNGRAFQGDIRKRIAELEAKLRPRREELRPWEEELARLRDYDLLVEAMIAGGDARNPNAAEGASSTSDKSAGAGRYKRDAIIGILREAGGARTTTEISQELVRDGYASPAEFKAFCRTVDAALRRGAKAPANCFRRVAPATWELNLAAAKLGRTE